MQVFFSRKEESTRPKTLPARLHWDRHGLMEARGTTTLFALTPNRRSHNYLEMHCRSPASSSVVLILGRHVATAVLHGNGWLHCRPKVIASPEESQNHWQQKDYKGFHSSDDWDTADFSKVRGMVLTSVHGPERAQERMEQEHVL